MREVGPERRTNRNEPRRRPSLLLSVVGRCRTWAASRDQTELLALALWPIVLPAYGAGLTLYRLGRLEEAEAAYVRALHRCPRYGEALTDFAELRLDQQRYEEALHLADAALEIQPRNANAWVHRSRALQHLGDVTAALDSIERALAIEPSDQAAREIRAQLTEG